MDYLLKLNEKQLEAVKSTEGYLRVIAGAGSGKTKLLVSRYAYLVKEYGIDSANILCVTFTNKAAGEMKRRIRALIGNEYDTSLICTYHGFCVRVLREDIEKTFYPKEFQIIDTSQQKAILENVYQKFELKLDHGSFEKIVKQISSYKSLHRDYIEKMCCTDNVQIKDTVETLDDQIIEAYLQHQKQIYAMDFNDLMYFTLDIFNKCKEVLEKWQDKLNYIQVDEFQDSSKTEMELINLLSAKHKNLMIVGDPDQNIYEWRGSNVKLLVDFDKTHIPTKTIFLNQNYRSTPQILKCANTLIEKNVFRLKKDLFTNTGFGADVYHYHTKTEYDEAEKIVELILDIRRKNKCNFSDFAVLYRSGFLSRIIEKKFTENGIPYEIFGGVKFYHRMEVQDIMAYLRLVAFDDDIAFKRIINKPRRRFGRIKLQNLQLMQKNNSLYETLKNNIEDSAFKSSGVKEFVNVIEDLCKQTDRLSVSEIVERICTESGYEKYIRELGDMERFENLSEFKRIATEYERNLGENITLKEFINQISLQSEDENEENADMVKLMTIHSAKGLEFPNVFVVGFSEGIFPSYKSIEERKEMGLEEERRLCYVAITRAEKRLFLLDSEGYTQNGAQKLPSRFLKEIGENNYIRKGVIPKELQAETDRIVAGQLCATNTEKVKKNPGDKVFHPAFGEGEIVGVEKNRNSYRIKFDKLLSERVVSAEFFEKNHREASEEITIKPEPQASEIKTQEKECDYECESNVVNEEKIMNLIKLFEKEQVVENPKEDFSECNNENTKNNPTKDNIPEGYEKKLEQIIPEIKGDSGAGNDASPENNEQENKPAEPDLTEYENLWNRDDVPKTGWFCVGVTDLGEPVGVCQMCGHQIIRYVHHMVHPQYSPLDVGCICAGKMEGDIEKAKRRENEFKNKEKRRDNFKKRKWKRSKNNNSYIKIKDHLIVLYYNSKFNNWKYSLDNEFCVEVYKNKEDAMDAAFEALERKLMK